MDYCNDQMGGTNHGMESHGPGYGPTSGIGMGTNQYDPNGVHSVDNVANMMGQSNLGHESNRGLGLMQEYL